MPETAKARQERPSKARSTPIGMNIVKPRMAIIRPMTKKTGRKSGIGKPYPKAKDMQSSKQNFA